MVMQSFTSIEEYIHSFPKDTRKVLQELCQTISKEIPDVEESMNYKMPTFKQNGSSVVYFACWKNHISLYPFSSSMQESIPESSGHKTSGKGTIQFPLNQPLPTPLIRKIVHYLVKENQNRTSRTSG